MEFLTQQLKLLMPYTFIRTSTKRAAPSSSPIIETMMAVQVVVVHLYNRHLHKCRVSKKSFQGLVFFPRDTVLVLSVLRSTNASRSAVLALELVAPQEPVEEPVAQEELPPPPPRPRCNISLRNQQSCCMRANLTGVSCYHHTVPDLYE